MGAGARGAGDVDEMRVVHASVRSAVVLLGGPGLVWSGECFLGARKANLACAGAEVHAKAWLWLGCGLVFWGCDVMGFGPGAGRSESSFLLLDSFAWCPIWAAGVRAFADFFFFGWSGFRLRWFLLGNRVNGGTEDGGGFGMFDVFCGHFVIVVLPNMDLRHCCPCDAHSLLPTPCSSTSSAIPPPPSPPPPPFLLFLVQFLHARLQQQLQ